MDNENLKNIGLYGGMSLGGVGLLGLALASNRLGNDLVAENNMKMKELPENLRRLRANDKKIFTYADTAVEANRSSVLWGLDDTAGVVKKLRQFAGRLPEDIRQKTGLRPWHPLSQQHYDNFNPSEEDKAILQLYRENIDKVDKDKLLHRKPDDWIDDLSNSFDSFKTKINKQKDLTYSDFRKYRDYLAKSNPQLYKLKTELDKHTAKSVEDFSNNYRKVSDAASKASGVLKYPTAIMLGGVGVSLAGYGGYKLTKELQEYLK